GSSSRKSLEHDEPATITARKKRLYIIDFFITLFFFMVSECNIDTGHDCPRLRINATVNSVIEYAAPYLGIVACIPRKCIEVLSRYIETKLAELDSFGDILRERIPEGNVSESDETTVLKIEITDCLSVQVVVSKSDSRVLV